MISCVILNLGTRRGHRKTPFGTLEDCIRIKILWTGPSSLSLGSSYQTGGKHQNFHKKNVLFVKMWTFWIYPQGNDHIPTKRDKEKSWTPRFRPVGGMLVSRRVHHPATSWLETLFLAVLQLFDKIKLSQWSGNSQKLPHGQMHLNILEHLIHLGLKTIQSAEPL